MEKEQHTGKFQFINSRINKYCFGKTVNRNGILHILVYHTNYDHKYLRSKLKSMYSLEGFDNSEITLYSLNVGDVIRVRTDFGSPTVIPRGTQYFSINDDEIWCEYELTQQDYNGELMGSKNEHCPSGNDKNYYRYRLS